MRISAFFHTVLFATLANVQWSWGAVQAKTGRVILRVWDDEIDRKKNPNEVQIQGKSWGKTSAGWKGRQRHIDMMNAGVETFAVVCHKKRDAQGRVHIARFEEDILLRLGEVLTRKNGAVYARIEERVSANEAIIRGKSRDPIDEEIAALRRAGAKDKEIEALIKLRIGQGRFRTALLRLWNGRCCVTGIATPRALRASHIKSWKASSKKECRDPRNGLPLVATLDALFDAGLISFGNDGDMLIAREISKAERVLLGLDGMRLAHRPHAKTAHFLKWHRTRKFKN